MLKTIEDHEAEVYRVYRTDLSGIECPNCKRELQFEGREVMTSSPPQKSIKCFNCNYSNRVVVVF